MALVDSWRLALDIATLACALGAGFYAHWRTRTGAVQRDIEALEGAVHALRDRVLRIDTKIEDTPTSRAIHDLAISISDMGGELKATVARLDGLGEIVKRLDRITERQETYLLTKGAA